MKILIINGVNLNMLGIREKALYGTGSYRDLVAYIKKQCASKEIALKFYQSNYEGDIVTIIQKAYGKFDGIVINAGAYTHTSIAILDALKSVDIPCAEVHITDISQREEYRKVSYISEYAAIRVMGKGFDGYIETIDRLIEYIKRK